MILRIFLRSFFGLGIVVSYPDSPPDLVLISIYMHILDQNY